MNRCDDDFLALVEPSAQPRRGGLADGSSVYADGLRRAKAGRRARREQLHEERRDTAHNAYVAVARVMGAAVVAAAAFAVLVFAGLFPSWPEASTGHRPDTLERQSSAAAKPASAPTTTAPPPPSTAAEPPPDTTTEVEPPVLPPSNPAAIRGTTTRAQIPARRSATDSPNVAASPNSTGAGQLSPASLPPVSGAPAPTTTTATAPNPNPAGHAPPGQDEE